MIVDGAGPLWPSTVTYVEVKEKISISVSETIEIRMSTVGTACNASVGRVKN